MKQSNKTLSKKELKYEKLDSDPKKRKKTPSKYAVVNTTKSKSNNIGRYISVQSKNLHNNITKFIKKHKGKKAKKPTKLQKELAKAKNKNAILGIGLLLVVVSIAYSTTVIFIGVNSIESKIALLPQTVFALAILIKAFSRLYK